jgi:hypothetical protein
MMEIGEELVPAAWGTCLVGRLTAGTGTRVAGGGGGEYAI